MAMFYPLSTYKMRLEVSIPNCIFIFFQERLLQSISLSYLKDHELSDVAVGVRMYETQ